ncbi:MAG: Gfo/Idh/MocA family oxidoreductase [Geminicoccaceae bacterium]|nr:Gfo/Idh/MocA family oxidoreductase [Geminicoccaceae bacterium]MCB9967964.1 Gfo/Idh/MocA family oxidoreductase [Geminicoccaceae bacterium]HRY24165.1 Gfo/Idh/MocA family oxidoreductase [Geminicoccaceae bacterium]
MRRVKMAVIGAGTWGENHAMAFSTYPIVDLQYICDLDGDRARRLAEKVGCGWTDRIEEIASSDVEAVSIATPDHAHKGPCLAMIEAGKHILVEKPFTIDLAEGHEIIAAAEAKGVKLMVDFQLRWHPHYMGAKHFMESGELGEGVMGYARLSDTIHVPTEMLSWGSASGPEWFLFPHTMDVTRWILDEEPVEVFARGSRRVLKGMGIDAYDAIQALFQFERSFVTFETAWIIPDSYPTVVDNKFTLHGSKGRIELDSTPGIAISSDRYKYPFSSHAITRYGKPFAHFYESIRHFADCVLEDKEPAATGHDGLMATAMIQATLRSLEAGRPVRMDEVLAA